MEGFTKIPNWAFELDPDEFVVYSHLMKVKSYREYKGEVKDGWFAKSQNELVKECCYGSNKTLTRHINKLVSKNIIEVNSTNTVTYFKINNKNENKEKEYINENTVIETNDNIEQVKASYKYYYRLTNYLQENNYTYKEELYKNVIYVTIPEIRMVVIVRNNDKISKSNNCYVLNHFIQKKYMPRCYDDNALKSTQFKSIKKRKSVVGRNIDNINNIPQPKIIEKKHKTTYEFADGMRNNPTKAEREFANVLNDNGILYEQQVVVKSKDNNKKYIADFLVGNIVIEVDGGYHFTSEQKIADENRTKDLVDLGLNVLRIKNEDVLKHTEKLDNLVNSLIAV